MMILTAALLITGCKAKTSETVAETTTSASETVQETVEAQESPTEAESESDEKDTVESKDDTETSTEQESVSYEDPKSLPAYSYQGEDKYLEVINDYLLQTEKETFGDNDSDVFIPFSMIFHIEDEDPEDIVAYGSYNIFGYKLLNTTLFGDCGSMSMGAVHLKTTDDGGYVVTKADLPLVSEEVEEVFAPVPGLYEKANELLDSEGDNLRAESIADYVRSNHLNITQWQDYGHAPVAVIDAAETPEAAQFYTFDSPFGYEITYDLRELSLMSSDNDMYGKVEEDYTGTLMVINKYDIEDADAAITKALSNTDAGAIKGEDAEIAGIPCRKAVYDEKLEDGRIFRYICYAVNVDGGNLVITTETTVEKGVSEISVEELEKIFKPTLDTFSLKD